MKKLVYGCLLILALFAFLASQMPTILPVSPITEKVDFQKGLKSIGPLELGPLGRSLKTWWNFEDFITGTPATQMGVWKTYSTGTGAATTSVAPTALRPGIRSLSTGTTTTGICSIFTNDDMQAVMFGGGVYTIEADIYVTTLSTVTEAYTLRFGHGNSATADFVDGAYFEYTDVGSTPNWYKCTATNSNRTKTDTTVAAAAGAWTRLRVVVNADGTSVEYFINGTSVGVMTLTIPGAGRVISEVLSIIKSVGTTARLVRIDWAWFHVDLAVSR